MQNFGIYSRDESGLITYKGTTKELGYGFFESAKDAYLGILQIDGCLDGIPESHISIPNNGDTVQLVGWPHTSCEFFGDIGFAKNV